MFPILSDNLMVSKKDLLFALEILAQNKRLPAASGVHVVRIIRTDDAATKQDNPSANRDEKKELSLVNVSKERLTWFIR